jgi:AcrR family transcriptional regulator
MAYHHGDLKNALLSAARAQLAERGPDNLSLRELARAAGVSPNAPYRHFEGRGALLAELATQGFLELGDALRSVPGATPEARLAASGVVYVDFVRANRALARLMFGGCPPSSSENQALFDAGRRCFEALLELTAARSGEPIDSPAAFQRAIALWSLVHGFALLQSDGALPDHLPLPEAIDLAALLNFGNPSGH